MMIDDTVLLNEQAMAPSAKKKIGLVIDVDNWAFSNISRQLQKHLSDRFDFVVVPIAVVDNLAQILMMMRDCQLVHFFWREVPLMIRAPYFRSYVESLGLYFEEFQHMCLDGKIFSTSIYDHLLLQQQELEERRYLFNEFFEGYTVASKKLDVIYRAHEGYPPPASIVEDGVDLAKFRPANLDRFHTDARKGLVIGWVGNSKWASELEDFKGVNTILKPAIARLREEGYPVTAFFADRQERHIPHDDMPAYYQSIDVLVCTSKIEGTPNPVLEAMACGVPIISTDVGIVPQAFGELQTQFILPERSVEALCGLIKRLLAEPQLMRALSEENLQQIQDWDWSVQARKFGEFFSALLAEKHV